MKALEAFAGGACCFCIRICDAQQLDDELHPARSAGVLSRGWVRASEYASALQGTVPYWQPYGTVNGCHIRVADIRDIYIPAGLRAQSSLGEAQRSVDEAMNHVCHAGDRRRNCGTCSTLPMHIFDANLWCGLARMYGARAHT